LAHLIQALILGTALSAGAAGQPFSHQLHLKLVPDCVACHASASTSTRVADNNLPKPDACRKCHKNELQIKAPAPTNLSQFSHEQHARLGNIAPVIAAAVKSDNYLSPPGDILKHLGSGNACAACHRRLHESTAVTRAAFPVMADCLVCHTRIDPPFSCESCHTKGINLRPADHVAGFTDQHSNPKVSKTGCAVCHGRRFTCLGCH
jgi:hypothetical protein